MTIHLNKRTGIGKSFMVIISVMIGIILIAFIGLWILSPGKIKPYLDNNGNVLTNSVSEIIRMEIGGLEQGIIVKGKNVQNPVMLFLHGGPGNPEYLLAKDLGLEDYFTVCYWEQRGGGMSYSAKLAPETITLEQMVADTAEVTNYLRERFGKDKIYLMGHSCGTFLGIHAVAKHPELFEAYIGISQVVNQLESEKLGYQHLLLAAKTDKDTKLEKQLLEYNLNDAESVTTGWLMLRSEALGKRGNGLFHTPRSQFSQVLWPLITLPEYTLSDKYGYMMGSLFMLDTPFNNAQFSTNIIDTIPQLEVPLYLFHGEHDLQVNYLISKEFFDTVQAPVKQFYSFSDSAHVPFLEEPEKFMQIVKKDILKQQ